MFKEFFKENKKTNEICIRKEILKLTALLLLRQQDTALGSVIFNATIFASWTIGVTANQ